MYALTYDRVMYIMKINIDVSIDKIWTRNEILTKAEMKELIIACLKCVCEKKHIEYKNIKQVFLNVSFVNSEVMKKYNLKYRGKDCDTNVLSFQNDNIINDINAENPVLFLGEMVLCYEKLKQEAIEYNKPFKNRLYHLFVHSVLHLLGYDHIIENERVEMEQMEQEILRHFGIDNVYFVDID